jgi:hypothetical protein
MIRKASPWLLRSRVRIALKGASLDLIKTCPLHNVIFPMECLTSPSKTDVGGGNGGCMTARDPLLSWGGHETAHKPAVQEYCAMFRLFSAGSFVDHAAASHDAFDIEKRDCSADFKKVK